MSRTMNNSKTMPRLVKEIVITVVSFAILCVIWAIFFKESINIPDESLSTIGLALSASIGVLTAIVVAFVLSIWQSSRQERSTSFWRWRDILHQLFNFYDANLEILWEIREEMLALTWASAEVSLVTPMPRDKLKKLLDKVTLKIANEKEIMRMIDDPPKNPSKEEVAKQRAYMDISNYFVLPTTANFEHNLSHYSYPRVLELRGLLYRLLAVLTASIFVLAIGVTGVLLKEFRMYSMILLLSF